MMAYPEYEKLFLLEVLVDSVNISNSKLDLDRTTKSNLKETCVMFQFLNYPPLVVCEEDFFKSSPSNEMQLNFKSGKSCIFSISSKLVPTLPYKFDVNVSVLRKVDPSKDKIVLGTSVINLGDSFAALVHSSVAEPDLPLQKTKSGSFDVYDKSKQKIGQITAFVRLSCFGQLIVTQFQVGANQDGFMFKGTEQNKIVEIPGDTTKTPKIEVDPYYQPPPRLEEKNKPDIGNGDKRDYVVRSRPETPCSKKAEEDEGNFKEIVAEIRGHALHIRVPMKSKKDKDKGMICKKKLMDEIAPVCKYAPKPNLCDCDFPVPPEAIPRCGQF